MGTLTYSTAFGRAITPFIPEVAAFRIKGFRAFPYLYSGSLAYEEAYLKGYADDERAMLVRVQDGGTTVAVATALPLNSSCDIVADAPVLMRRAGYDPDRYFYYAEILVDEAQRGRGIAQAIYAEREKAARLLGFDKLCLAVVERAADHPLRPAGYQSPERIWIRDGFTKTDVRFSYGWPTIQPDGTVREQDNPMVFWVRDL
jgi:GNAT superfamily N-acetyltransferase